MTYAFPSCEQPTGSRTHPRTGQNHQGHPAWHQTPPSLPTAPREWRPILLGLLCLLLPLASLRAQTTSRYTQVSGGETYTMALRADGTLWAWGGNSYGQLGTGNTTGRLLPAQVAAPAAATPGTTWTSVSSGPIHVVARRSDATLWGWGYNNSGQLGDGTTTNRVTPVLIAVPAGAAPATTWGQLSTNQRHTLALRSDGSLWAWGENASGVIGDNSTTNRLTPTAVTRPASAAAGTTWAQIAAGIYHSVALRSDGTLWTWGYNSFGQLGDASTTASNVPVAVVTPGTVGAGTRWTSVAASDNHTVALRSDGSLWAWGYNAYAQLCDNSLINRPTPVRETTSGSWGQIATSRYHTLAISTSTGQVFASGFNAQGQLGGGNTTNSQVLVASVAPVLSARPAAATRLAVYPNPARGQCQLPALPPAATLQLTDSQGRLVRSQPAMPTLNLVGLTTGLYLLRVQAPSQPPRLARLVVE